MQVSFYIIEASKIPAMVRTEGGQLVPKKAGYTAGMTPSEISKDQVYIEAGG